jgi:hypothetical protein
MDTFDKKPILPVEAMIIVAINIVIAVLGYYVVRGRQARAVST